MLSRKTDFTPLDGAESFSLRARISVLRKTWEAELVYGNGATVHLFTLSSDDPGEIKRVESLAKELNLPVTSRDLKQG